MAGTFLSGNRTQNTQAASHSTGTVSKHEKTKFTTFRRSPVISVALPSFETDYISEISRKIAFEPSEPFALALRKDDTDGIISLSVNDQRLTRYLKGETLNIEQGEAAHTKGLAPSLCRRLPSRFRQAGRQYLQKQISRRLESLTSCPAGLFASYIEEVPVAPPLIYCHISYVIFQTGIIFPSVNE